MLVRTALGLIVAMVVSMPLFGLQSDVASFEVVLAQPLSGWASDPAVPNDRTPNRSDDQGFVAPGVVRGTRRDGGPSLNIYVLVGQRAVNSITTFTATAPLVEVRDGQNMPVEGAEVVFLLPSQGPGGFFAGQQVTWMGKTDANGQVVAASFVPNQQAGQFVIQVTAKHGNRVGSSTVTQRNSNKETPEGAMMTGSRNTRNTRMWKIAAVAAGGAAVGIILATRGGGDKPTIILQPGNVSLGGPR